MVPVMPDDTDFVVVPIEDSIDLHSFQPQVVPAVVESYLLAASEKGLTEVRLVHGRGMGVQRARVHWAMMGLPPNSRMSSSNREVSDICVVLSFGPTAWHDAS